MVRKYLPLFEDVEFPAQFTDEDVISQHRILMAIVYERTSGHYDTRFLILYPDGSIVPPHDVTPEDQKKWRNTKDMLASYDDSLDIVLGVLGNRFREVKPGQINMDSVHKPSIPSKPHITKLYWFD